MFLQASLSGCATPAPIPPRIEVEANLRSPCEEGPPIPQGDGVPLDDLVNVALQREKAAALCRKKVVRLIQALESVQRPAP